MEKTLETVVFLVIIIMIGTLFIFFLHDADYGEAYRSIRDHTRDVDQGIRVSKDGFSDMLMARWRDCGYGEINSTYGIYVEDEGIISKEDVIDGIMRNNLCHTLGCGNGSKLIMENSIDVPKVINIRCSNNTLVLS